MALEDIEKHLLAGIDDRLRGFSRQVDIEYCTVPRYAEADHIPMAQAPEHAPLPGGGKYRATLQYEKLFLASQMSETREEALRNLVSLLQARGYKQLRSRLSFVGGAYLGNVEAWIEYPDPEQAAEPPRGFMQRLGRLWQRFFHA